MGSETQKQSKIVRYGSRFLYVAFAFAAISLALSFFGQKDQQHPAVAACAKAIGSSFGDSDRGTNIDRNCDGLSMENQKLAAEIASKKDGFIVFVPPYEAKQAREAPPKPAHHYVMQDGMQYGYPAAISEFARQGGQAAQQLVMAYYAGERGGKYQAHIMDGQVVSAIECVKPCEYAKIMTYIDDPYLRDQIKVERLKVGPANIAYNIMDDAAHGRLKTYGREINGKRYTAWMDEKKGMQFTPIAKK